MIESINQKNSCSTNQVGILTIFNICLEWSIETDENNYVHQTSETSESYKLDMCHNKYKAIVAQMDMKKADVMYNQNRTTAISFSQ